MDSIITIAILRNNFAQFELPNLILSDNGTQFTSIEFGQFCSINGIKHAVSAPYHTATNGAAENAVLF